MATNQYSLDQDMDGTDQTPNGLRQQIKRSATGQQQAPGLDNASAIRGLAQRDIPLTAPLATPSQAAATATSPVGEPPTPAAASDRKDLNSMIQQTIKNVKPIDMEKLQNNVESIYKKFDMDDPQLAQTNPDLYQRAKEYKDKIQNIAGSIASLRDQAKDESNRSDWMRVAEQVGNAVAQFGAGLYGARHGVDTSGIKFSKNDWDAQLKNKLELLNNQVGDLYKQQGLAATEHEKQEARAGRAAERTAGMLMTGEKERIETERHLAQGQITALVEGFRSQQSAAQHQAQMAQGLALSMHKLNDQEQKTALGKLDKMQKDADTKLKGIDSAISMLDQMDKGDIKESDKANQDKFKQALAISGLNASELDEKMNRPGTAGAIMQFFAGQDKQAGISYLKNIKAEKQKELEAIKNSYDNAYSRATGGLARPGATLGIPQAATAPATPATPKQLSPEDKSALDWANANPNDPRAAQIKQRLGQ